MATFRDWLSDPPRPPGRLVSKRRLTPLGWLVVGSLLAGAVVPVAFLLWSGTGCPADMEEAGGVCIGKLPAGHQPRPGWGDGP